MWTEGTSRRTLLRGDPPAPKGLEVLDATELLELNTAQLLAAMQEPPSSKGRRGTSRLRRVVSSKALFVSARSSCAGCGGAQASGSAHASTRRSLRLGGENSHDAAASVAALMRGPSASHPELASELGSLARELEGARAKAAAALPPVDPPWRPRPREDRVGAPSGARSVGWHASSAALGESKSAPALAGGGARKGWAAARKVAQEAAGGAGMTREAARERARQLRHKVATAAREVTAEQERKRLIVHQSLARLMVDTPQYVAGRDLPRMDQPLDIDLPPEPPAAAIAAAPRARPPAVQDGSPAALPVLVHPTTRVAARVLEEGEGEGEVPHRCRPSVGAARSGRGRGRPGERTGTPGLSLGQLARLKIEQTPGSHPPPADGWDPRGPLLEARGPQAEGPGASPAPASPQGSPKESLARLLNLDDAPVRGWLLGQAPMT
eukprot:Transcript_1527.p1 GENE.Transcript_1527~~Transcript_1527.p1  ORF type:complete len:439 (+),score=66.52 Transcript_1527:80-1396(+)